MVIVVYDDEAYGAEVHHFGPDGHPLDMVEFPPADLAAIGRGFGCAAVTVREPADLAAVADWVAGPRDRPMLVDAKVTRRARRRGGWRRRSAATDPGRAAAAAKAARPGGSGTRRDTAGHAARGCRARRGGCG